MPTYVCYKKNLRKKVKCDSKNNYLFDGCHSRAAISDDVEVKNANHPYFWAI